MNLTEMGIAIEDAFKADSSFSWKSFMENCPELMPDNAIRLHSFLMDSEGYSDGGFHDGSHDGSDDGFNDDDDGGLNMDSDDGSDGDSDGDFNM